MAQPMDHPELRGTRRMRVLKMGKIIHSNNASTVDCKIRDISETGAKLVCGEQMAVPGTFRFVTQGDNLERDAKVMWRKGNEVGITFTSPPRPTTLRKV